MIKESPHQARSRDVDRVIDGGLAAVYKRLICACGEAKSSNSRISEHGACTEPHIETVFEEKRKMPSGTIEAWPENFILRGFAVCLA